MKKLVIRSALIVLGLTFAAQSHAATVVGSDFAGGNDGWQVGEFQVLSTTNSAPYNAAAQRIDTLDQYGYTAFVAPLAFLGNKAAAFGGLIRFDLADTSNDGVLYSPLTLIGGGVTLYALPSMLPSTDLAAPSTFSIDLVGSNFRTADQGAGAAVSDATLLGVLTSLDRIGINADWTTGSDFTSLDNVALCDAAGCSISTAVPEPTTWAMMVGGFGLMGAAMRRRQRPKVTFA